MDFEIPLQGGRSTVGVVRVGDTVRRPLKQRAAFVHRLLQHLERQGFSGAPKFLGVDDAGRETLSFVPGSVPPDLGHFTDHQLSTAARLLRALHDATLSSPLVGTAEVVCHGDASPCNCVFVDGLPVAFIDFDEAHPGSRTEDVGYAAWLWIDIGNQDLPVEFQALRIENFFACYGIDACEAVEVVIAAMIALAERTTKNDVREWSKGCRDWMERHRLELRAAIERVGHRRILERHRSSGLAAAKD